MQPMVHFICSYDPRKRITAAEALEHEYVLDLCSSTSLPVIIVPDMPSYLEDLLHSLMDKLCFINACFIALSKGSLIVDCLQKMVEGLVPCLYGYFV